MFISFEGIEGTGKSTQCKLLAAELEKMGREVVLTAEPGGTQISLEIRKLLLDVRHKGMEGLTELLLYAAARRQHLVEKIIPAIEAGKVVITDRFSDSTMAYQGYARGLGIEAINQLDELVTGSMKPNLTLLLDLEPEVGLSRNRDANKVDRLELEALDFHKRVRQGFLAIQKAEPERVRLIDASMPLEQVHAAVMKEVAAHLSAKG